MPNVDGFLWDNFKHGNQIDAPNIFMEVKEREEQRYGTKKCISDIYTLSS